MNSIAWNFKWFPSEPWKGRNVRLLQMWVSCSDASLRKDFVASSLVNMFTRCCSFVGCSIYIWTWDLQYANSFLNIFSFYQFFVFSDFLKWNTKLFWFWSCWLFFPVSHWEVKFKIKKIINSSAWWYFFGEQTKQIKFLEENSKALFSITFLGLKLLMNTPWKFS